jgi:hypothetical protein
MDIHLNAHDLILAAHQAGIIEGVKSIQLSNGQIKNKKISGQGDFAIHYAGMLGEIAVSKAIGIPIRTDITFGGDGSVDMIYKGQSLQIKTSTHPTTPHPRYIIFNNAEDFSTDWAVSCSIQTPCLVKIHGFVSKKRFLKNAIETDFGYGARLCIAEEFLTSIDRFDEAVNTQT